MDSHGEMAKCRKHLFAFLLLAFAARSAAGQSFGVDLRNTLTPASRGMAGTSIAAPQDFLSGINANPATLTQYHVMQFLVGGAFVGATFKPGLDFDALAGGMLEASELLGATGVSIESYWIGAGLTWRFDRSSSSVN